MTGTDTETKKRKSSGPRAFYYIDSTGGTLKRVKGQPDETQTLTDIKEETAHRLFREGYIFFRSHGFSHDDILSGEAFPDRALPGVKVAKAPKAAKVGREPNAWLRAIATVKGRDFGAQQRAALEKETRKENYDRAIVWVKTLTTEQIAVLKKHKLVKLVHAELTGDDEVSFDDLLNGVGTDQTEAEDAVDATDVTEPTATTDTEQHAQAAD